MKTLIVFPFCLLLVGCFCPVKPDVIVYRDKIVEVPVEVPCKVNLPVKPSWVVAQVSNDAGLLDKGTAVLKEVEQRRQYERELEAAMKACAVSSVAGNNP